MGEKLSGGTIIGLAALFVAAAIIYDILHSPNAVPLLNTTTSSFSGMLKSVSG